MSIHVEKITKKYGKQKALDNISFEIKTGDIVGFIGPNGAGKSTMMKIITGFIPQNSGNVKVENIDISADPLEVKKNIGYLPEHNPLYLDMYVREYLSFVAGLYKLRKNTKARVEKMIEQTGLYAEQNKKIGALSKGYRQRVGLAQALIHDPKVLVLDEPTSGLDPNQIVEIRNLISELGKEKTVMLSTHIMQEVEAICDKVIIINKGRIVADDYTKDIQSKSQDKQQTIVVEFEGTINKEDLKKITGVTEVAKTKSGSWLIQSSAEKDIRSEVFNFAVKQKTVVLGMQKKSKSLEDVFQELTRDKT